MSAPDCPGPDDEKPSGPTDGEDRAVTPSVGRVWVLWQIAGPLVKAAVGLVEVAFAITAVAHPLDGNTVLTIVVVRTVSTLMDSALTIQQRSKQR